MPMTSQLPPLALYIHTPWCISKCPYCDFNSHQRPQRWQGPAYVEQLLRDLSFESTLVAGRRIESIFIGGGTPSLFSGAEIHRLLSGIDDLLELKENLEVTLEANPGTLESGRYGEYLNAGVNRLSIGVQSLDPGLLQALGRIHSPDEVYSAFDSARTAGFDNINLDVMYGLPGQNRELAIGDIEAAVKLGPEHISYYQLTLEPNTLFHAQPPALPPDELIWEIQLAGHEVLAASGYRQYEVSAFARPDARCQHNLNYWTFGDYLGIGAGAHGKISSRAPWRVERRWRDRSPESYLQVVEPREFLAGNRILDTEALVLEFMMNALRLREGVPAALFCGSTGLDLPLLEQRLSEPIERGLLEYTNGRVCTTPLGWRYLDDLLTSFISGDTLAKC